MKNNEIIIEHLVDFFLFHREKTNMVLKDKALVDVVQDKLREQLMLIDVDINKDGLYCLKLKRRKV